jgi:hypothetical protein
VVGRLSRSGCEPTSTSESGTVISVSGGPLTRAGPAPITSVPTAKTTTAAPTARHRSENLLVRSGRRHRRRWVPSTQPMSLACGSLTTVVSPQRLFGRRPRTTANHRIVADARKCRYASPLSCLTASFGRGVLGGGGWSVPGDKLAQARDCFDRGPVETLECRPRCVTGAVSGSGGDD